MTKKFLSTDDDNDTSATAGALTILVVLSIFVRANQTRSGLS